MDIEELTTVAKNKELDAQTRLAAGEKLLRYYSTGCYYGCYDNLWGMCRDEGFLNETRISAGRLGISLNVRSLVANQGTTAYMDIFNKFY